MAKHFLVISICLLSLSSVMAQDTLVGWTFPEGSKNELSNLGNELNKGGMFMEAAKIDEIPFSTIYYTSNGYNTKSAVSINWDSAKDLKCWKFSCDATGYQNMIMYARVSSDSILPGPRDFKIQYRLGCCSPIWIDVPGAFPFTVSTDWTTANLSGVQLPADADNMSGLQIRFVCVSDTATDGSILIPSGKSLIDEVYITGSKITSINEKERLYDFTIYPNPASEIIQIKAQISILDYQLFDVWGRLVKSDKVNSPLFTLYCSGQKPGWYIVDLNFEGNNHIKQKILIK